MNEPEQDACAAGAFFRDGFAAVAGILAPACCDDIATLVAAAVSDGPGTRGLLSQAWCKSLASSLRAHPALAAVIPAEHVAVQCTYFEKSVERNWLVPIHQDLAIPVAAHVDDAALRGWSNKEGSLFVQPPAEVLEQLVAVRVHLDDCQEQDGPLQFVAGTHRLGRIDADQASVIKGASRLVTPVLARGDVLLMRPLVLHASSKASGLGRRRVLHFVFGPADLPFGLRWEHAVA